MGSPYVIIFLRIWRDKYVGIGINRKSICITAKIYFTFKYVQEVVRILVIEDI